MLPGVSGSLIAAGFLENVLHHELGAAGSTAPRRASCAQLLRWWRRIERTLGPASSARAVLDIAALPLADLLGYTLLHLEPYADGFVGTLGHGTTAVAALRTTLWGVDAEAAWRDTVRAGRTAGTRWGLVYTGRRLRIIDASRTWSRRAVEFDLALSLDDERSMTTFWALACCRSLATAGPGTLANLVDRSDEHGVSVCALLGDGVLDALTGLLTALDGAGGAGGAPDRDTFEQAVTIVYRLLFLLFAEARSLVPTWHPVYRDAYSLQALCRRSTRRPRSQGLWAALQAISRLAHAGCRAGDLIVTPFNGRLFSPRHTPLAERELVSDAIVGRAVVSLATGPAAHGRQPISYADLGVEQLGAVYERVLEYEPARRASSGPLVLTRTSNERKTTGSFYTPRAMTEFLVRRTLSPLVAGRSADQILALRVVDPAMGSGAFLVAACRYLASAIERALAAQGDWKQGDDVRARRAELRRVVCQRSLYGVDLNPMAVQLARLSLWLTTLAVDRPLTFLDHHLVAGDSLLGAGLHDLARRPPGGRRHRSTISDRALPLLADQTAAEMATTVLPDRFRLSREPADTLAAVREKEHTLAALVAPGAPLSRWKAAADLWCAGWFWPTVLSPGVYRDVLSSLVHNDAALSDRHRGAVLHEAASIAREHRFFHWELEFPEVFFTDDGRHSPDAGFDAVIGNPPWDVLRADTGDRAARDRDRRDREARLRFFRDAGIFRLQGTGHANRYQLFLERALQLTRAGGRMGLVLPSGLATDHGSGALRRAVLDSVDVDRLLGFDNRKSIFPIHRDMKFLLLTGTRDGRTERLTCSFGRSETAWLDELPDAAAEDPPDARLITFGRSLLESWDPEHLTFPLLTRAIDLEILAHVSALVPRLDDATGWAAKFGRELNATEDRPHFVTRHPNAPPKHGNTKTRKDGLLTVVEGKHLEPFRVRTEPSGMAIPVSAAKLLLDPDRTFRRLRLAYRDVASATNRLTLISALLPPGTVSTHTIFCLKTPLGEASQYCLLALVNSLVANYLVRLHVTTHVSTAVMARLPVPRPGSDSVAFNELGSLARSLERSGMSDFDAYARLNAIAADLYQLSAAQYEHVVATFPLLPHELRHKCIHAQATETQSHRGP